VGGLRLVPDRSPSGSLLALFADDE